MDDYSSRFMTPDEITGLHFESRLRGIDPTEVGRHLERVSSSVRSMLKEISELEARVVELEAQVLEFESSPDIQPEFDEQALTEQLGHEAARVLTEARAAAADRIADAERQADEIRAAAETIYGDRSSEADAEGLRIVTAARDTATESRQAAEREAQQIREAAEQDAEQQRARDSSNAEVAEAKAASVVREAEVTRRQILEDLTRRRSSARRQIEQLRAGRERLLQSHEIVRRALDEISEELTVSMSEARAAAETAAYSVSDSTVEELEAEIESSRIAGLLDTGPMPVVKPTSSPSLPTSQPLEEASAPTEAPAGTNSKIGPGSHPASASNPRATAKKATDSGASSTEAPAADKTSTPAVSAGGESTDEETDTGADQNESSSNAGAAPDNVVSLKRIRDDVDTTSHPAARRETSRQTSDVAAEQKLSSVDEPPSEATEPTKAEPAKKSKKGKADIHTLRVADPEPEQNEAGASKLADDPAKSDSVGSLFDRIRVAAGDQDAPDEPATSVEASKASKDVPKKKKKTAKKSAAKDDVSDVAADDKPEAESEGLDQSDALDQSDGLDQIVGDAIKHLARRLKRVLADEQSAAMSTLKSLKVKPDAAAMPVGELLGDEDEHIDRYWIEVEPVVTSLASDTGGGSELTEIRNETAAMVVAIRRRVDSSLVDAGDDTDAAVASLRSVYREVKIKKLDSHAEAVCNMTMEGTSS